VYYNATGGATFGDRLADYDTYVHPNRPAANGGAAGVLYSFAFVFLGTNDSYFSTPSAFAGNFDTYLDRLRADGITIIYMTGLRRQDLGNTDAAIAQIVEHAMHSSKWDYIIPTHALFTDPSDTRLVNDGVHPNNYANALLAKWVNDSLLNGGFRPVNIRQAAMRDVGLLDYDLPPNKILVNTPRLYVAPKA